MNSGVTDRVRRHHKRYLYRWIPCLKKTVKLHRYLASEYLGRPLLPGEVVHHRDGDSTNNSRANLIVLPSQAYHAHLEHHLRQQKRGMPPLFPELFVDVTVDRPGTLFECLSL